MFRYVYDKLKLQKIRRLVYTYVIISVHFLATRVLERPCRDKLLIMTHTILLRFVVDLMYSLLYSKSKQVELGSTDEHLKLYAKHRTSAKILCKNFHVEMTFANDVIYDT